MDILTAIMWMCPQAKWHFKGGNNYEHLVWDDEFFPKPTEVELETAHKYAVLSRASGYDYRIERKKHYPTAEEQLAMIYDLGLDGWKAKIDAVKLKYPKIKLETPPAE
jgi:hypothetical protein